MYMQLLCTSHATSTTTIHMRACNRCVQWTALFRVDYVNDSNSLMQVPMHVYVIQAMLHSYITMLVQIYCILLYSVDLPSSGSYSSPS